MTRGGWCCHWKPLLGVAVAGLGLTLLLAPGSVLAVLPLLCVIVCPLSMVLMMAFMGRGRPGRGDWAGPTSHRSCRRPGRITAHSVARTCLPVEMSMSTREDGDKCADRRAR